MKQSIVYDNRKFTLGTAGRYFFARVKGENTSLHRYKYTIEKGSIPDGWHVHHKDGNCFNNDIENLEAIDPKAHAKLHPVSEETLKKWQEAGIAAAPVWHASKEGEEWHRQHYENIKAKIHERVDRVCSSCNKPIKTSRKNHNAFCSNNCKSAWRRKHKPDRKVVSCPTCRSEFETLKYLPNTYCSKQCKPAPNKWGSKGKPKDLKNTLS